MFALLESLLQQDALDFSDDHGSTLARHHLLRMIKSTGVLGEPHGYRSGLSNMAVDCEDNTILGLACNRTVLMWRCDS